MTRNRHVSFSGNTTQSVACGAEPAKRFNHPVDPLRMIIVRDMWLTGFDVPCLHTMYADKPMLGHGLMQSIARVRNLSGSRI